MKHVGKSGTILNLPGTDVTIEVVRVIEHCEEREGASQDWKECGGRRRRDSGGRNEYLLAYISDTFPTSHLLTSLSNFSAWRNTARREKARVRIVKNVAEGDDGTAGEGMNTYCVTWWLPRRHSTCSRHC